MSSRSGAPSLAQKGRDASPQSAQLPTPIPSTHYGGGGLAEGVSSSPTTIQSTASCNVLNICMIDKRNIIAIILFIMMKAEVIIAMVIILTIEIGVVVGIAVVAVIEVAVVVW